MKNPPLFIFISVALYILIVTIILEYADAVERFFLAHQVLVGWVCLIGSLLLLIKAVINISHRGSIL